MMYFYPHPERFADFEKPDLKQFSGNIVLWGAGRIGGIAEWCLRKQGVEICAFCDIETEKWGTKFCGHDVLSPKQLKESYPNAVIVISTIYHEAVYENVVDMGYKKVFDSTSIFLQIDFEGYDYWMLPEYAIRNVEQYMSAVYEQTKKAQSVDILYLNITTKCSLRCRDCSAFIPYVKNPCYYDAETVMKDMRTLLDYLGHVRIIDLYGGEPMLHPELTKMVKMLKDERRTERIGIITNGTITPNAELLDALEDDRRVLFRISDYGELSSKIKEITRLLSERNIEYEITNYTFWERPSVIAPCEETEEQTKEKFRHCVAGHHAILMNRKLYQCLTAGAVDNIGALPPSESNYVDFEKYAETPEVLHQKIDEFLDRCINLEYFDACRYCSGLHCVHFGQRIPVAVQTKEKMEFMKLY